MLLKKVREIRKATGISIPFPEDSQSLMDAVLQAVLLNAPQQTKGQQLVFDFISSEEVTHKELIATKAINKAQIVKLRPVISLPNSPPKPTKSSRIYSRLMKPSATPK